MLIQKNLFKFLSILIVLSMVLVGCSQPEATPTEDQPEPVVETEAPDPTEEPEPEAKTYKLALIQFLKGHPVHRLMQLGFEEGCKELGAECDMLLTDSTSPVDMIPLAEQALAQGYDGVVLYAVDDSFFPTIQKFNDAGIPVVTPHFTSFEQDESGLTAVVGADVVAYSIAAAEAMGEQLGGEGVVAVTVGSFNETENLVAETFKATMNEKYPNVTVLDPQEEGFDQAQAIAKAVAIIQGNPDIAGGFSTTGNGPTTWGRAAEETGIEGLVVISMDYTRPNLDLVKEGLVYGLVAQPLYEEFYSSVDLLLKELNGESPEYLNLLPAPIITVDDLDAYYGFNDRAEAGIEGAPEPTEEPEPEAKTYKLALIQFLKGHPVHRLMQLGFEEGCEELGAECDMLLTDSTSPVDMIPLAEQALAQGYDGVVLYAVDDSFFPTIQKFNDAGIPVVTPHFTSFEQDESGLTAVVGADVVAYSIAAAEAMGEQLGGEGVVAVTVGSFNETENLVAETFKATMNEKYPNVTVLDPQEEGFDQAQAIAKAVAIIQGNPDIAGGFSTTGNGPTTWGRAAEETGIEGLVVISMDYTRPNLDLVKEGLVYGLVAQPLYEEFYASVDLLLKALNGEPMDYRNLLPAPIITVDDLDAYYGFNDRAEEGIDQ